MSGGITGQLIRGYFSLRSVSSHERLLISFQPCSDQRWVKVQGPGKGEKPDESLVKLEGRMSRLLSGDKQFN